MSQHLPGMPPPASELRKHKPVLNLLGTDKRDDTKRRYNPYRDIAYVFPQLMKSMMENLAQEKDPRFREMAKRANLSEKAFADAAQAFCRFCAEVISGRSSGQSAIDTAVKTGLATSDVVAEYVLMGRIGMVMMAFFHDFFNDAFIATRPIISEQSVYDAGKAFFDSIYQTSQLGTRKEASGD